MSERDTEIQTPNYDAILPAAGAFTDQDYSTLGAMARRLTIGIKYTKHASATTNKLKLQVQWKLGNDGGYFEPLLDGSSPTIAADVMRIPEYRQEVLGPPVIAGNSPLLWRALMLEIPSCATGVRVLLAEVGDTTNPGTVVCKLYFSSVN